MAKRFFVACFLFSATAFAAERHIVRFNGAVPKSFANAVTAAGGTLEWSHSAAGLASVSGLTDDAANGLAGTNGADAVADVDVTVRPGPSTDQLDGDGNTDTTTESASDPTLAMFYSLQWNLHVIGANAAWAAGRHGSPDVTVAVIDSGIDYTHVDLAGRVDLSRSVSFIPSDDAIVASMFPGHHPVTDLYFHGTHVASTITSNAVLAAGVTSNVTLIGVKVIDRNGNGSLANVLAGVLWAADHGADVANMSLGGAIQRPHNGRLIAAVQQAMNYAYRKGTLLVVAAGNESADLDHDGATLKLFCDGSNVVCVSATGPTAGGIFGPWTDIDAFAWFSNYGRSAIDVAAPGGNRLTVIIGACAKTALVGGCPTDWLIAIQGTSMAAPHASGLAALIVEDVGHGNPAKVKARLLQGADDLGAPGTDPQYGKGRINVPRSLGLQ
ncbi:MAG TPA: S8 family serine peptidase [Thermoanaerobaculia bacterium]|nr:S8 family serine peptidase [Thermoanaerobaculia bacterium]